LQAPPWRSRARGRVGGQQHVRPAWGGLTRINLRLRGRVFLWSHLLRRCGHVALSRSTRIGTLVSEPSARDRETPEHGVERLACLLHALGGAGELEEDRALGSFHDGAEELVAGLLHHGRPEAAAAVGPLSFHQVHLEAIDLLDRGLRLDRLAVLATELLGPAPDVGLHAAALAGTEVEDRELRRIRVALG